MLKKKQHLGEIRKFLTKFLTLFFGGMKFFLFLGMKIPPFFWGETQSLLGRAWVFELIRVAPGQVQSVLLHLFLQLPGFEKVEPSQSIVDTAFCYFFCFGIFLFF